MSFRRSSIDRINQKYRGSAVGGRSPLLAPTSIIGQSPIRATGSLVGGVGLRPSVIGTSPIARQSVIGQVARPSVIGQQAVVAGGARRSVVGGRPLIGVSLQPAVVAGGIRRSVVGGSPVFGVSPPAIRRSFVGSSIPAPIVSPVVAPVVGPSAIGRGTIVGGPIIGGGIQNRVTTGVVGAGFPAAVGGFRRSVVQPVTTLTAQTSPAVYEVHQNPPIIEAVTTPPRVYEVVQPIVEVTPDIVTERRV